MRSSSIKTLLLRPLPHSPRITRVLIRFFMILFSPFITIEHAQRLKSTASPVLFSFNHNHSIETIIAAAILMFERSGRPVSFVIDWMYGKIPPLGWLFRRIDPIYVYNKPARFRWLERLRKTEKREHVYELCARRLKANRDVGIFPEGTRNKDPVNLKRGRMGVARIVLDCQCKVVPIGIVFKPRINMIRKPFAGSIVFRIGREQSFSEEKSAYDKILSDVSLSSQEKQNRIQGILKQMTSKLMLEIALLSGKHYPFDQASENSEVIADKPLQKKGEAVCQESMP